MSQKHFKTTNKRSRSKPAATVSQRGDDLTPCVKQRQPGGIPLGTILRTETSPNVGSLEGGGCEGGRPTPLEKRSDPRRSPKKQKIYPKGDGLVYGYKVFI